MTDRPGLVVEICDMTAQELHDAIVARTGTITVLVDDPELAALGISGQTSRKALFDELSLIEPSDPAPYESEVPDW